MIRNRDRRGAAPHERERSRSAGTHPSRSAPEAEPRRERAEKRDADVVRIYGFHSVEAALKVPRRALVRLYATAAAAERLKPDIAARGVETRILTVEEIAARAPRNRCTRACCSRRGRSPRLTFPNFR